MKVQLAERSAKDTEEKLSGEERCGWEVGVCVCVCALCVHMCVHLCLQCNPIFFNVTLFVKGKTVFFFFPAVG